MTLSTYRQNATAAREAYDIQVIQNESSIANDKLNVRFALLDLQKYLSASLANELVQDVNAIVSLTDHVAPIIAQAQADPNMLVGSGAAQTLKDLRDNIVLSQGNLKNAQATLIGTEELHDANYVSDLELAEDELTLVNRQFDEEGAHVNMDLFMEYDFPKNAEQLLSVYIEAGRQLQRTYAQCRSQLAQRQATLTNAELTYQHQDKRVKEFIEQIDFCTIRAKAPGLVIYGSGSGEDQLRGMRGKGIIAEGENVWEGLTIISMPDTAEMVAEIGIHETEVDKVRPGQPAEIVMDAFPDSVLQGEGLEVAPLPDQERSWLNPDLKLYKTLVKINGTHDYLKTRMSCMVQILIQHLENVVMVPIQVVANRGGRKVCYVKTPQGPEEREVRTGAFNYTFTEIIEGLEPGEEVLLNPPMFTEGVTDTAEADQQQTLKEYGLTYADAERFRNAIPDVQVIVPNRRLSQQAGYRTRRVSIEVVGTVPWFPEISNVEVKHGRFLCSTDMHYKRGICAVDEKLVRDLFAFDDPLGQDVKIASDYYRVVGVVTEQTSAQAAGSLEDKDATGAKKVGANLGCIYIPLNTVRNRFGEMSMQISSGSRSFEKVELQEIIVKVREIDLVMGTRQSVQTLMSRFHKKNDYEITVPLELMRQAREFQRIFTIVLGSIAAISLFRWRHRNYEYYVSHRE